MDNLLLTRDELSIKNALDAAGIDARGSLDERVIRLLNQWKQDRQWIEVQREIAAQQTETIDDLQARIVHLRREIDRMGGDSAAVLLEARMALEERRCPTNCPALTTYHRSQAIRCLSGSA